MSSEQPAGLATESGDYGDLYYNDTHLGGHGDYSWESEHWRTFFRGVARKLTVLLNPRTSLDVGCAKGLLVQALAEIDVDAQGTDISEYAVSTAHPDVRDRLSVTSATEPIEGRYDLISCIEVLEHMSPEDASVAMDNLCAATDRVLFSSTPTDFGEATHVNVNPTARWASWFAERGFYRRTDLDLEFVSPWAAIFERGEPSLPVLVEHYEALLSPLKLEVADKRRGLLEADRDITELKRRVESASSAAAAGPTVVRPDDLAFLKAHEELTARDHVIGLEATVTRQQRELVNARDRVMGLRKKLEAAREEIKAIRASTTWKLGRSVTRPLGKLRG